MDIERRTYILVPSLGDQRCLTPQCARGNVLRNLHHEPHNETLDIDLESHSHITWPVCGVNILAGKGIHIGLLLVLNETLCDHTIIVLVRKRKLEEAPRAFALG